MLSLSTLSCADRIVCVFCCAHRKVKQLEEQLQEMQKLANDDTQSEDRRSLLMRCDRAETRARKNEEQMMGEIFD